MLVVRALALASTTASAGAGVSAGAAAAGGRALVLMLDWPTGFTLVLTVAVAGTCAKTAGAAARLSNDESNNNFMERGVKSTKTEKGVATGRDGMTG